jgi:uncharacterized phage protein (TIGR02218 family)
MKSASAATLAILATGQYFKFEFYDITLASGTVLRFTNADASIKVGGNTYLTGLTLKRTGAKQKVGLGVQEMVINASPQSDNPAGAVMVAGYPFLQAVNVGVFDGARVLFSKGFFNPPVLGVLDTTPGLVAWTQGKISNAVATRSAARLTVADDTQLLNTAMPRNLLQTGCVHTLFDAGCNLSRASFTSTNTVSGTPTVLTFNSALAHANGYFDLGIVTFTSGPNNGLSRVVKRYVNAGGNVTVIKPWPAPPAAGNSFTISPGCDKLQATCSGKFSNLSRFRGVPYIPVPETIYGGAETAPIPTIGDVFSHAAPIVGSDFGGKLGPGTYVP